MSQLIQTVNTGAFKTTDKPVILVTYGVGSCVVLCLFDPVNRVAGMAHVALPRDHTKDDLRQLQAQGVIGLTDSDEARFADIAVDWMIEEMITRGADSTRLVAKIAGGADMFPDIDLHEKLGLRNIQSVEKKLSEWAVKVVAADIAGNTARTVTFFADSGQMRVETADYEKMI